MQIIKKYETLEECSVAAIKLNIKSSKQYYAMYKQDSRLPSTPQIEFAVIWDQFGGWDTFLGRVHYATIQEASDAAIALNIKSYYEYVAKHHLDPLLPVCLYHSYKKDWKAFGRVKGFLKLEDVAKKPKTNVLGKYYLTIEEASIAAANENFETQGQYNRGYKSDPMLPSSIRTMYPETFDEFGGFEEFFKASKLKAA
jgi:hypothetical protein